MASGMLGSLQYLVVLEQENILKRDLISTFGLRTLIQLIKFNEGQACYVDSQVIESLAGTVYAGSDASDCSIVLAKENEPNFGVLSLKVVNQEIALLLTRLAEENGKDVLVELKKLNKHKPCNEIPKKKVAVLMEPFDLTIMPRGLLKDYDFQSHAGPFEGENSQKNLGLPMTRAVNYGDDVIPMEIYRVGEKLNAFGMRNKTNHGWWFEDYNKGRAVIATLMQNQNVEGKEGRLLRDRRNIFFLKFAGITYCLILTWDLVKKGWEYNTNLPGSVTLEPEDLIFCPGVKVSELK